MDNMNINRDFPRVSLADLVMQENDPVGPLPLYVEDEGLIDDNYFRNSAQQESSSCFPQSNNVLKMFDCGQSRFNCTSGQDYINKDGYARLNCSTENEGNVDLRRKYTMGNSPFMEGSVSSTSVKSLEKSERKVSLEKCRQKSLLDDVISDCSTVGTLESKPQDHSVVRDNEASKIVEEKNPSRKQLQFSFPLVSCVSFVPRYCEEEKEQLFYTENEMNKFRHESHACERYKEMAEKFDNIGRNFDAEGYYDKSIEAHIEALRIRKRYPESNGISTAITLQEIGNVQLKRRFFPESLSAYAASLTIRKEELGLYDMGLAVTLCKIGYVQNTVSNHRAALKAFKAALAIREIHLGTNHMLFAETLESMGISYVKGGKFRKALSLLKQSLQIKQLILGQDDEEVGSTFNNIANVHYTRGDLDEALEAYEKCLEIKKKTLGNHHLDVATTLNNMASVFLEKHQYTTAAMVYAESLEMQKIQCDGGHEDVIQTLCNVGDMHKRTGERGKAEETYSEALWLAKLGNDEEQIIAIELEISQMKDDVEGISTFEDDGLPLLPQQVKKNATFLENKDPAVKTDRKKMIFRCKKSRNLEAVIAAA